MRASGLDISAEHLVSALLDAGHEVTVVAGTRAPQTESLHHPALTIHRLTLGPDNWIGYALRAARVAQRLNNAHPFDVTHFWDVHFAYAYRTPYVASLHQSFRQRWQALGLQERWSPALASRWTYYTLARVVAEKPSLRRAGGLLAVSAAARDEFVHNYGIMPERIALARHSIDTKFFTRRPNTGQIRAQYRLDAEEPVILFAGFVSPRKGLPYLAAAMSRIYPHPKLLIAGRWSVSDRSRFVAMMGEQAGRLIETGFVPDNQMPDLYSIADVYVSPSLLEGFGLPLAEALACETPVVAANVGSVAEVVGPGGILVPPKDAGALADAVSILLQNSELRRKLGILGRRHIEQEFSPGRMYADTVAGYRRFSAGTCPRD